MVRFGVGMAPVEPLKKVVATAKLAEELGFEYVVHADQRFAGAASFGCAGLDRRRGRNHRGDGAHEASAYTTRAAGSGRGNPGVVLPVNILPCEGV